MILVLLGDINIIKLMADQHIIKESQQQPINSAVWTSACLSCSFTVYLMTCFKIFYSDIFISLIIVQVKGPGIGLISISHSGGLALAMSSFLSGITATVCVNGCIGNTVLPLRYKDLVFPPLPPDSEKIEFTDSGLVGIRDALPDPSLELSKPSIFPIERATCQFLFAAAEDDHNWNSVTSAKYAAAVLKDHGKDAFELVTYPKAGHFLEVPHMPFCASAFHAAVGTNVAFGGEPKAHCEAQIQLWEKVQEFFGTHLGNELKTGPVGARL